MLVRLNLILKGVKKMNEYIIKIDDESFYSFFSKKPNLTIDERIKLENVALLFYELGISYVEFQNLNRYKSSTR